jgi:hypothetical protein
MDILSSPVVISAKSRELILDIQNFGGLIAGSRSIALVPTLTMEMMRGF